MSGSRRRRCIGLAGLAALVITLGALTLDWLPDPPPPAPSRQDSLESKAPFIYDENADGGALKAGVRAPGAMPAVQRPHGTASAPPHADRRR